MQFVSAIVAAAPIRSEASHSSEMISQLLFGEKALVLDQRGHFTRIKCLFDHYEGWVQSRQLTVVSSHFIKKEPEKFTDKYNSLAFINEQPIHLSVGTPIYNIRKIGDYNIRYKKQKPLIEDYHNFSAENIEKLALQYLNTPYLWGGRGTLGIDCSGFAQNVLKQFGKTLPRDASQQALKGDVVGFLMAAQCGDLAFFDNEEEHITHVGILLNANTIIHASSMVRIDNIDNEGIINKDLNIRTHKLRIIKRY